MSKQRRSDQVSLNIFDLIDQICADFRQQWKAGKRPHIEDFLLKVPENAREQLFRNLLPIETRYRERGGDKPQPGDYLGQFPQYKRVIGDAFNFSTSIEMQAMQSTPADDSTDIPATIEAPAANRIGEYELIRELGRGGFGVVYEAKHVTRRNRVALKTLPTGQNGQEFNAERLHKFRQEFRNLSEVNHPNLVGMQTLEVDGGQWFFTMDLIEGEDFLSYVRPSGKLDEGRLRESLQQLVAGVVALHEQRILHRDLKPSNVLVRADGRVLILDFGLVAQLEQRTDQTASLQTQHFAGTPRYAPPEQFFGGRSPATDWYALGTMLFEALTGKAPYAGTAAELLIRKREEDAPPLSGRDDLPADLAALTDQLLRRDPERRPASERIAEALAVDLGTTSHSSHGSHDDEHSSVQSLSEDSSQILIGREEQLAQLEEVKQRFLNHRQPEIVWLTGLSGEGKSSLAEKFLASLRRSGQFLVLSGRCYDRESVPFKAVDVLIETLVSFLRYRSQDQVSAWLPRDMQMLARLFPTLRRVDSIADQPQVELPNADDRQLRYRAFAALRDLLISISRETPIVLFIDDLQWGDADSGEALADLLRPPNPPELLLLGSYRSDEASQSPFLQQWKRCSERPEGSVSSRIVEVTPLTEEQCLEFMSQRLNVSVERLREQADDALAETKGNPYFLEQLIEGFNTETGQFEPVPLRDIIERKIKQLPDDAQDLLNTIAIAGQAVSVEEASSVAGYDIPAFSTVTHMRSERLVRLIGSGEQQFVDTYHDKIRETVLREMSPDERRLLHCSYGEWLERHERVTVGNVAVTLANIAHQGGVTAADNPRVYDIAHHFFGAQDERAFVYQLFAGVISLGSYASEEAMTFLERANHLVSKEIEPCLKFILWHSLGQAWLIAKEADAAELYFTKALEFASTDLERALALASLGYADRDRGRYDTAIRHYDDSLAALGAQRPRSRGGKFAAFLMETLRCLLSPANANTNELESETVTGLRIRSKVLSELSLVEMDKNVFGFLQCISRDCLTRMQIGSADMVLQGLAYSGFVWMSLGGKLLGKRFLHRAAKLVTSTNDSATLGFYMIYVAAAHYWSGNLQAADRSFDEALGKLRAVGQNYLTVYTTHIRRHVCHFTESSTRELHFADRTFNAASELGNEQQTCWGAYDLAVAYARLGDLPAARRWMDESLKLLRNESYWMTESIRGASLGFVLLQSSDYRSAREYAGRAWRNSRQHLMLHDVTAYSLPVFMESILGPHWIEGISKEDNAEIRRLSRWARLLFHVLPNHQPHLLRMRARWNAARGRMKRAGRLLERAIAIANDRGMKYPTARCLLDLAAVKADGADRNRAAAIEVLLQTNSVIPHAESWLLGDQYDESVVAPDFDQEAWEREHGSQ